MKKSLVAVICVIVLCSLLAVPLLLRPPLVASQDELQTTPKITPYPDLKSDPEEIPQSTPQNTPQPTQPTPTASPSPTSQKTDDKLEVAINNAITYLEQTNEAFGLMMLNVIYRQFGIQEFKNTLQRYDQLYASSTDPLIPIWRRIADYDTSAVKPEDFDAVTDPLNRLTIPALFSDRKSLPDDYVDQLTNAVATGFDDVSKSTDAANINDGAYLLTHALLANIWLQNNNCSLQLPEGFISSLYEMNAALIGDGSQVDDIQLEAAAFLYEAGQGNLVNPNFVQNVIDAQFTDGGWFADQEAPYHTDWHPSVLALMMLLHVAHPATSHPPMLAPPPN